MKKLLFLLTSIFLLYSCGESSGDLVGLNDFSIAPGGTGGNTKVIKKITVAESGSAPYDINYTWSAGKLVSVSTSDNSSSYSVEYTGIQISKIIAITGQGAQMKTTTSTLVYNAGLLTQVNGVTLSPGTAAKTFKTSVFYTANRPSLLLTERYQPNSNTQILSTLNNNIEYNAANVSKMTLAITTGGTTSTAIGTYTNYDVNPNPLHTLPLSFTLANADAEGDDFGRAGLSANNAKTVKVQFAGLTQTENVVYTYGTDNFPTKSVSPSVTLNYEYTGI